MYNEPGTISIYNESSNSITYGLDKSSTRTTLAAGSKVFQKSATSALLHYDTSTQSVTNPDFANDTWVTISEGESYAVTINNKGVVVITIVYHKNDGSYIEEEKQTTGTSATVLNYTDFNWKKDGYDFKNWNTKSGGGGTSYSVGSKIQKYESYKVHLYAQWSAKTFYLTIKSNNTQQGTVDKSSGYYSYGEKLKITAEPKEHYEISYWTIDSEKITPKSGDNVLEITVKQKRTITAYFKKKSYKISVKAEPDGAGTIGIGDATATKGEVTSTIEYGNSAMLKQTPNIGWVMSSWSDVESKAQTRGVRVDGDAYYIANYIPKEYTVKLFIPSGQGGWSKTEEGHTEPNSTFTNGKNTKIFNTLSTLTPNTPLRTGYKFIGWYWTSDDEKTTLVYEAGKAFNDEIFKTIGSNNTTVITLKPKWEAIENVVKYHYFLGDGETYSEITKELKYTIETPSPFRVYSPGYYDETATRSENAVFLGWTDVKPNNWGDHNKPEGHGTYLIPSTIPKEYKYSLPYEINILAKKTDPSAWNPDNPLHLYGFWTVTGKYIKISDDNWKKVSEAYFKTSTDWKSVTDILFATDDGQGGVDWVHEVTK